MPDHLFGETPGALATLLRSNHNSSLIAVTRDGISHASPPADFMLREGDCAIVVAESLTALAPLQAEHALSGARSPVARPA